MADNKAIKIWEDAWKQEIHTTDYALKRIKSAKSAKLTPIKIDTTDFYGYFQGSHGKYETFLDFCPCGDFYRSKLPCKHIYRLAMELGLMNNSDVKHNIHAIVIPKNERVSLDETINLVENLSEMAQYELLSIATNIRSTTPTYLTELNTAILELINSGIVIDACPGQYKINFKKKSETTKLLDEENISYDKKARKGELEEICIKYIAEKATEKFGKCIYVSIPKKFSTQKIHYYLHRKYDFQYCFNDNIDEYRLPLVNTDLPDDDVTEQLIKHGYYSRE